MIIIMVCALMSSMMGVARKQERHESWGLDLFLGLVFAVMIVLMHYFPET